MGNSSNSAGSSHHDVASDSTNTRSYVIADVEDGSSTGAISEATGARAISRSSGRDATLAVCGWRETPVIGGMAPEPCPTTTDGPNSEVLPAGSVAVALITYPAGTPLVMRNATLAFPLASVIYKESVRQHFSRQALDRFY